MDLGPVNPRRVSSHTCPGRDAPKITLREALGARRAPMMPMGTVRRGHTVALRFDLPGVTSDALGVTVERNVLTVRSLLGPVAHRSGRVASR